MQALGWNLCPETAVSWLTLYFQMASMNTNSDLLEPQFPLDVYVQMTRVGVRIHLFKSIHNDTNLKSSDTFDLIISQLKLIK